MVPYVLRVAAFLICNFFWTFYRGGVNFGLGALGRPVSLTAIAFGVGLLVISFAVETRGQVLPD